MIGKKTCLPIAGKNGNIIVGSEETVSVLREMPGGALGYESDGFVPTRE